MSAPDTHDDHPNVISRNARYGLILFAVYFVLYAGFIGFAVFGSEAMSQEAFGGVNLATLYGLGLIVVALVLAAIYTGLCARRVRAETPERDRG